MYVETSIFRLFFICRIFTRVYRQTEENEIRYNEFDKNDKEYREYNML